MESRNEIPAVFNPQPRNTQHRQLVDVATVENRATDDVQLNKELQHKVFINIVSKFICKTKQDRLHSGIFVFFFALWLTGVLRLILGGWSIANGNLAADLSRNRQMYYAGLSEVVNGILNQLICFSTIKSALKTLKHAALTSTGVKAASFGFMLLLMIDIAAIIYIKDVRDAAFHSRIQFGMLRTLQRNYGTSNDITLAWDNLQTNKGCCGAINYSDWFNSTWASPVATARGDGVLPISCLMGPTGGACEAFGGAIVTSQPNYIVTSEVTMVEICDSVQMVYIFSRGCGELFIPILVDNMEVVLLCVIGLLVVTLIASIFMFALARLLPRHQRVTSAYSPDESTV